MIADFMLALAGGTCAFLAMDNWRLRKRLRRLIGPVESINVLSNGVVLPEPDDERWTMRKARRYLDGYKSAGGHPLPMLGPEETMLVLGEIAVALHDRQVFIDNFNNATKDDPKSKRYAEAVVVAHFSRRALVSIECDPDGQT